MNKTENFLKALLLKEYEDRLKVFSLLRETSALDKEGNIVLDPDLKVRHKSSGFEYTVKKVVNSDGRFQIILRTPESPRFEPSASPSGVLAGKIEKDELGRDRESGEFQVDREDFEKNYEVD